MGKGFIGVGALVYNDLADGGTDGAMGSVFAAVSLGVESGPNGAGYFAEYCAFRPADADFNDTVELIGGNNDTCPRFTSVVVPDVPYALSIELDPARKVLSFRLGDELIEYAITTDVFEPHRRLSGARAQANDDASVVGYIDDLSFSSVPVLLAESDAQLGGLPPVITDPNGTPENETTSDDSGSGGGGGGSIAVALLALAGLIRRRYRLVF
jgi:MYXO-CTERM domain-containing protein